jgi:hypothetical protein
MSKQKVNDNIFRIDCTKCQPSGFIWPTEEVNAAENFADDLLDLPNRNNSFLNALDDSTTDKNVIIKNLYSNDELSAKYNYIFNKLL